MKGFRVWGLGFSFIAFVFLYPIPYILYPTYALENDIGYSSITPGSPFYFLKGVRESIETHLAQTKRVRMVRELEFATRRLREARVLIGGKDEILVVSNLERYWINMSTVIEFRPRDEGLTLLLNSTVNSHLKALEDIYNKTQNARVKMSIRSAIFRLLNNADISKEEADPYCELLSKEASSSALTQSEQAILKERAKSARMCLR